MKPSSASTGRKPLDRQTAWGCLTSNLALPGFGSLMARQAAGFFQAPLGLLGLVLTLAFGGRFVLWFFANWPRMNDPESDPVVMLSELWLNVRWAVLGVGLFALSWLWALASSLSLLRQAKKESPAGRADVPPRIGTAAGKI